MSLHSKPTQKGGRRQDHDNTGLSMWMTGGGVRGGTVVGGWDEIGMRAIEQPDHLRDIHAMVLHPLGLDQDALSYLHQGRRERSTGSQGGVIRAIV
jgi:hypothetical protein